MDPSPELPKPERRRIPGTAVTTSLLAIAIDPGSIAPPSGNRALVTSLRLVRQYGVTTFAVRSSGPPSWAERAVIEAFPERDPELVIILSGYELGVFDRPGRARDSLGSPSAVARASDRSLREDAQRLGRHGSVLVDLGPGGTDPGAAHPAREVLEQCQKDGVIAGWSSSWPGEGPGGSEASGDAHPLVSAKLSLLESSAVGPLDARASRGPLGVLVHDPFSGGLLDGTRIASTLGERGPRFAPPNLRSLQAEIAPVLRLEYLTRSHRRTLAQAALQFVFRWPWVSTVLVPLPRPERWTEIVGAVRTPPLDAAELETLGISPGASGSAGSRGQRSA